MSVLVCEVGTYATFSSRFIMANMKSALRRQRPAKTSHTVVSERPPQRMPPTLTRRLPMAVATNQPPIIMPLYFGGATLLTKEMPMGESSSSPKVSTR